ncbi:cadherin-like protein 26 isoform X2 [Hemibagrus wyckioides]|uniref:cadherin-like protein 26 isoform X2 n=1 Tax=Hemibagrus wyckioides TaxID=337641 RepID=UPI00266B5968|nr:cadherin-like protein 26 isoform X2 [Hemibagrus wyckioides]
MFNTRIAACASPRMRKTIIVLLFLALWAESSHDQTSQEKSNKKTNEGVLTRSKRRWVLSTLELDEEIAGPYPQKFTELYNDKHLNHSIIFKISGQGVTVAPLGVFSINEKTGDIFVNKPIDRESYPILKVKFDVLDQESHTIVDKTLAFDVVIRDKNDNPPTFIPEVLNINIPENTKEGRLPILLQARDIDEENTANSRVSMRIVSQEPALPKMSLDSILNEKDAILTKLVFTGCFDYDKVKKYKLLVKAWDHGTPSLSSTATVNIHITDSNTHIPVFTAPKFNTQVMEMETNKEILRIPVQDMDTPNTPGSRAVFTILKGNEEGNYKIETDPITNEGVLTVIKGKDYEQTTLTELEIGMENEEPLFLCVDGKPVSPIPETLKRSNPVKVDVKVIDVNDPPVFHNKIHKVYRIEEDEPGDVLYIPTVTDEDSDTAKIRYELVEDPAKWMSIDPQTGIITLAKKMDRESPYVNESSYTVVIRAIDNAEPPGTGTGILLVKLGDKNDNAPYLTCNPSVICGNKADRVRVTAKDADVYPYSGPFTFTLGKDDQELKSLWKFEHTVSESLLISLKSLPYGNYSVPLKIADQQGVQTQDVLQVVVCDCGDGYVCKDLLPRSSTLHGAALGIMLGALMAFLLCIFFVCKCHKKNIFNQLHDDVNPTLIKYSTEGGVPVELPWVPNAPDSRNIYAKSSTATYSHNFIVLLVLLSQISPNWSAPDNIRCPINGK